MLIVTTDQIPGKEIKEVIGVMSGGTVQSKNIGKDIGAGLKGLVGGEMKSYTAMMEEAREQSKIEKQAILEEARKQAEQLKVNAQRDIEDEKKRALEEINKQIADLSVLVASKILEKELDGSTQSEYVDKVIKEVGVK